MIYHCFITHIIHIIETYVCCVCIHIQDRMYIKDEFWQVCIPFLLCVYTYTDVYVYTHAHKNKTTKGRRGKEIELYETNVFTFCYNQATINLKMNSGNFGCIW